MPPGSSVTYTVDCLVAGDAEGTLENTATAVGSVADPTPGDRSATDGDTVVEASPLTIPVSGTGGLVLLATLLAAAGAWAARRL